MSDSQYEDDLMQDIADAESVAGELIFLFGEEIVEQARLIDIADLNLTDEMTRDIGDGIKQLKQLKHDPEAQRQWVAKQSPGICLLLCLWIMDMGLLSRIQMHSYL